jgi:hypothetical protein
MAIQAIQDNGLTCTDALIGLTTKDIENVMTIVRKMTPPIVVNYISQSVSPPWHIGLISATDWQRV